MSEPSLYLEPQLRSAQVKGRRCSWRELGEGARLPLLLLHGIGSNASSWAGQFAGLAGERRVIAWNAPGYLASDCLDADWPAGMDYAEAAIQLLDHLEIARFILLGQSLGAVMATSLAIRAPDRVAALVLTSPASGYAATPGAALPDALDKRLRDLDALGPAEFASARADRLLTARASGQARKIVQRSMSEIVPEGYIQATRLLATSNLLYSVKALSVPTLVLWGAQDEVTPPASCRKIAQAVPNAQATEIPGGGHALATELPTLFNEALRPFLWANDGT